MEANELLEKYNNVLAQINFMLLKREALDEDNIFNILDNIQFIFQLIYEKIYLWKIAFFIKTATNIDFNRVLTRITLGLKNLIILDKSKYKFIKKNNQIIKNVELKYIHEANKNNEKDNLRNEEIENVLNSSFVIDLINEERKNENNIINKINNINIDNDNKINEEYEKLKYNVINNNYAIDYSINNKIYIFKNYNKDTLKIISEDNIFRNKINKKTLIKAVEENNEQFYIIIELIKQVYLKKYMKPYLINLGYMNYNKKIETIKKKGIIITD